MLKLWKLGAVILFRDAQKVHNNNSAEYSKVCSYSTIAKYRTSFYRNTVLQCYYLLYDSHPWNGGLTRTATVKLVTSPAMDSPLPWSPLDSRSTGEKHSGVVSSWNLTLCLEVIVCELHLVRLTPLGVLSVRSGRNNQCKHNQFLFWFPDYKSMLFMFKS